MVYILFKFLARIKPFRELQSIPPEEVPVSGPICFTNKLTSKLYLSKKSK